MSSTEGPSAAGGLDDERFEMLVDGVKDYLIFMLDPEGVVMTWNSGAERATGYRAQEVVGRHVAMLFPTGGDERTSWASELTEAARTGRAETQGWRLRKDGTRFWVNAVVTALRAPDGQLRGFAKITRDLTESRATEVKLRESEQRLHLFIGSIRDYAIFMLDPSGRVMTWNPGAEHINGYRAQEIIGEHFSRFYLEDDVRTGKCERELVTAASSGTFEEEGWRVRKGGERFWASVVITAVRDERGELIGFGKVTRDLSARRHAEEKLRQSELQLRQLIDSIRDYAVIMLDPSGHIATWNPGAERIKGYAAAEIIGQHFSRFYPREDVELGKCDQELVLASVGRFEEEGWRVRKDGSHFWASVVINAVRSDTGELVGYSKVTRDLTERRRMEEERAARRAAEESSRLKDEFLAILGHELRNPLAPMVTAMKLLDERYGERAGSRAPGHGPPAAAHGPPRRRPARCVAAGAWRRHPGQGGRRPARAAGDRDRDVEPAARAAPAPARARRAGGGVVRARRPAPPGPGLRESDDQRGQVYRPGRAHHGARPGGRRRGGGRGGGQRIRNPPELLPRLFDLFVQGYQSSARAGGGLGLGLTIVKSLVELHGGTILAASPGEGRGSTFSVRLPRTRASQAVVEPSTSEAARSARARVPARVLLVDDNEDARELTAIFIARAGHHVVTAADGPAALALAAEQRFDVAILDIGLPVMDGYELAGLLRQVEGGRELNLVALTGYGQASDIERSRLAGFQRHLTKPVDPAHLLATIATLSAPST